MYSGQTRMLREDPSVGWQDVVPVNLSNRKSAVFVRDGMHFVETESLVVL